MMLELTSVDTHTHAVKSVLLYYNAPPLKQTTLERSTSLRYSPARGSRGKSLLRRARMGGRKRLGGLLCTDEGYAALVTEGLYAAGATFPSSWLTCSNIVKAFLIFHHFTASSFDSQTVSQSCHLNVI